MKTIIGLLFLVALTMAKTILGIVALVKFLVDGDLTAAIVCLSIAVILGGKS